MQLGEEYNFLKSVEKELQTVFIVSDLEIVNGKQEEDIIVDIASGEKCDRCWMYSESVGKEKEHPTICHKCSQNLN